MRNLQRFIILIASIQIMPIRLRVILLKLAGVTIGENSRICYGFYSDFPNCVRIGDNSFVNHDVEFLCNSNNCIISIGNNVWIAPQVSFCCLSHEIGDSKQRAGKRFSKPITVQDGAWICIRVTILPGITIGSGAIVCAGSVVTKDVPPNTMVAGIPATVIKNFNN